MAEANDLATLGAPAAPGSDPTMSAQIKTGARLVLGLVLVVFGLNGFLNFLPQPPLAQPALDLIMAMAGAGYLLKMVKVTEIAVGLALLSNSYVPLSLVVLAPVSVNIVAFHAFLDPAGIGPAALVFALNLYLGLAYLKSYQPLLQREAAA